MFELPSSRPEAFLSPPVALASGSEGAVRPPTPYRRLDLPDDLLLGQNAGVVPTKAVDRDTGRGTWPRLDEVVLEFYEVRLRGRPVHVRRSVKDLEESPGQLQDVVIVGSADGAMPHPECGTDHREGFVPVVPAGAA